MELSEIFGQYSDIRTRCGIFTLLFTTLIPIIIIAYLTYNVYFHPLSSYPGPFWSCATHIPRVRALLTGKLSYYVLNLHEKYGDVVRIGPNELSYNNAEAWKDIYGHRGGQGQLPKDPYFYTSPPGGVHSIITADAVNHTRIRKLISYAFSEKALREQEPLMRIYIDLLIQRLRESSGGGKTELDIVDWYNWTTFDIISDLMFGESFDCLADRNYHPWVSILFSSIKAATIFSTASLFPGAAKLMLALAPKKLIETRDYHMQMIIDKTQKRLDRVTDRADFMSYIVKYNDERGMTVPEIQSSANAIIIAGSETTATLLSGTTYYLLKNPETMKKLVDEIRGSFSSEKQITLTTAGNLKYLLAVLEEGMRMYPPVPVGLPRKIPAGGAVINNRWVPPKTLVSVNQYATYHTSKNFVEPNSFNPERFLDDPRFASDNKDSLQPFSVGPRNCIGQSLAYAEMRLILARILWNFDLHLTPGTENWENQEMYILWQKGPLKVTITERK
ncbi:toxin biosynthesis cytochrome P450 monooxygenase [Xylogone sp. PMI_703]|nr:toxin biosynthesis cytochrome P450 monooxygenase [Xylogone sp. PMI_703]